MLTDQTELISPHLTPLVVGSPVARALHDLWVGQHSVDLVIEDYDERLLAAATIAAHLAQRASMRVVIRLLSAGDRLPVLLELDRQLLDTQIASADIGGSGPVLVQWEVILPGSVGATVTADENYVAYGHRVSVVVAGVGRPAPIVDGRSVTIVASANDLPTSPQERFRLGDLPLDFALAGAPETGDAH